MQIIHTLFLLVSLICGIQAQHAYEQDFDNGLMVMARRSYEAGYAKALMERAASPVKLSRRAATVTGVRDKCARCMLAGLRYTAATLPAHLNDADYSRLQSIGTQCTLSGDCAGPHDKVLYGEATMWQKAQGHDRGAGSRDGSQGGSSGGSRGGSRRGSR